MLLSLYNKHNTNIHAPGGIRTHERQKTHALDRTAKSQNLRYLITYI
jgi:hypothetical protein